ncbi:hypothetical protein [Methanobacterium formicicum]|uniref:hypothetical protein n=1 Tax=Methanobacterium formicicum TaxID=2162 RepID=UPI000ACAA2C3|nr:hypothetical protein [Methanobacterium formicicum]
MAYLKRELGLFDVVNLVIGTIVGADIYIAAAFGAGYLGPSSIFAWLLAGLMAITIALCLPSVLHFYRGLVVLMPMLRKHSEILSVSWLVGRC